MSLDSRSSSVVKWVQQDSELKQSDSGVQTQTNSVSFGRRTKLNSQFSYVFATTTKPFIHPPPPLFNFINIPLCNISPSLYVSLLNQIFLTSPSFTPFYRVYISNGSGSRTDSSFLAVLGPVLRRSDEHEYSNIRIKWPSNIICIRICAISPVRTYSDIHS